MPRPLARVARRPHEPDDAGDAAPPGGSGSVAPVTQPYTNLVKVQRPEVRIPHSSPPHLTNQIMV